MTPLNVDDLMGLQLPRQQSDNGRYLAEPLDGFGVCSYIVPPLEMFCIQCFPILNSAGSLTHHFVSHTMRIAGRSEDYMDTTRRRKLYPYMEAPDVLTAFALITNAANNWKENLYV